MKSIIQVLVAFLFTGLLSEAFLFGTPFYNGYVIGPLFVGAMYVTALVQHWFHWRRSSRRGMPGTPGAKANGADRGLSNPN